MCPSRIIILVLLMMCTSGYTEQNEQCPESQKNCDMVQRIACDTAMLMEDMKKPTFMVRNELNSVLGKLKAEQNSVIEDLKPVNR